MSVRIDQSHPCLLPWSHTQAPATECCLNSGHVPQSSYTEHIVQPAASNFPPVAFENISVMWLMNFSGSCPVSLRKYQQRGRVDVWPFVLVNLLHGDWDNACFDTALKIGLINHLIISHDPDYETAESTVGLDAPEPNTPSLNHSSSQVLLQWNRVSCSSTLSVHFYPNCLWERTHQE